MYRKTIIYLSFFIGFLFFFGSNVKNSDLVMAAEVNSSDNVSSIIYVLDVEGVIDPIVSRYIMRTIDKAQKDNAQCLIIKMDTPGGLVESMRNIVLKMENSDVPIVVYVTPVGARAVSAGVFITLASDVAVMALGTHMGSAHPVDLGQKMDKEMTKKVVNDLVSFIVNRARSHNRNAEWAEQAVRESVSITSDEAVKEKVVDFLAKDFDELLLKLDKREIVKKEKKTVLNTAQAIIKTIDMNFREKFLHKIANPNLAYILMIFGIYGIIYEFHSPGVGFAGTVGGICLILAFLSLQILPVNLAGVLLIILGILLLVLELWITSYGILSIGGVIAFIFGSFILMDSPQSIDFYVISKKMIIGIAVPIVLFFSYALTAALKIRRSKPTTGQEGIIGKIGYAKTEIAPEGMVYVEGEYWSATAKTGEVIEAGEKIKVTEINGKQLKIIKFKEE